MRTSTSPGRTRWLSVTFTSTTWPPTLGLMWMTRASMKASSVETALRACSQ
jgi:hypothetical protein